MKLTGTNRSIGLIVSSIERMRGDKAAVDHLIANYDVFMSVSSTWWFCRGFPTRSHSELGS